MKLSTKRGALLVNGALAVLLAGGAVVTYVSLRGTSTPQATVATVAVTRGTILSSVSASGSVESSRTRSLAFGTSGTVKAIYVEEGEKVDKGQLLATLDDKTQRENISAAAASLDVARTAYDDDDSASNYANYVRARNTYNQAQRVLGTMVLTAPFAGTITTINGQVGGSSNGSSQGASAASASTSSSSSSSGFMEMLDTKRLQIVGNFTESDVTKLKVGQTATITFDALPGVSANGKVTLIDPNPTTSNNVVEYAATIALSGVPSTVRLGQTATVTVVVGKSEDALLVPSTAVSSAGGRTTVRVLAGSQQVARTVSVGVQGDAMTEITSGLQEGEQVVRQNGTTGAANQLGGFGGGFFGGGPAGPAGGAGGGGRGAGGGR
ncbi:HlyD family efflux transporter periplasmic adaptor subunit [Streptosporangiaceae bacterium NEAU-GS5]|nr:HlyD family efflux transporter periplasmic adaptor subunit [Streptosporangiaceae bacterium NEAU-GS5]